MSKLIMIAITASPFIACLTDGLIPAHFWLMVFFVELWLACKMITDPGIGPKGYSYFLLMLVGATELLRLRLSDWQSLDSQVAVFTIILAFVESVEFYKKYESEKHKNEILEKRIEELERRIQNEK